MMEYIISQDSAPTGDLYEDETYCTRGLCAHPSCWESHIRTTRGFKKYISSPTAGSVASGTTPRSSTNQWPKTEGSLSDDDGLSTLKVMNMLDEYGESAKDLYPSRYAGQPSHKRFTEPSNRNWGQSSNLATPSTSNAFRKAHLFDDLFQSPKRDVTIKPVEVQEVFDLDELSQNWDSTFITKPVYVWVPAKDKRHKKKKKLKSTSRKRSSLPGGVAMKDVTNDMLPRGHAPPTSQYIPPMQTARQPPPPAPPSSALSLQHPKPVISRSKSPIPTGGQPYHNVGQTPKDRMRFRVIMNELKDLPRPFVLEVLEKARGLENKEDVLMLMERYLKTMKKSDWELSMVTGKVLQQQRLSNKLLEESERLPAAPTNSKMYKLDEQPEAATEAAMTSIPADVIEGSMSATHKYPPLPVIGEHRVRKKNTVRVHVSTTTKESVKPFQYKKQSDVEFCLERSKSGEHLTAPSHLCKHYLLYQFCHDHGLCSPLSSLASDYCHLVCANNNWWGGPPPTPNKLEKKLPSCSKPRCSTKPHRRYKLPPQLRRYVKNFGSRVVLGSSSSDASASCPPCPREVPVRRTSSNYKLRADEIPNLAKLPAIGVDTKDGMKPFFNSNKSSSLQLFSTCSPYSLSQSSPTRSLSTNTSRPDSQGTAHSAPPPTIPGADMSVLYDQESVERNANNNAIDATARRKRFVDGTGESGTSSVIPKAPVGTPYTPKTPYRPSAEVKAELNESSPDGAVRVRLPHPAYPYLSRTFALEVIQEAAAVDDFPAAQKKTPNRDLHLTSKSVIDMRSPNPHVGNRRVVSASLPRVHREDSFRRGHSANASMAVVDMSSVAQLDQDAPSVAAHGRTTTSRLEIVSTTSQWPTVDEEALLREQTTPELIRVASAPVSKHSKDGVKRSSTLPPDNKETEHQARVIVVDMPSLKQPQNSPAPPPPSPEPADKVLRQKQPSEYPDGQPVMADVDIASMVRDEQVVGKGTIDGEEQEKGENMGERVRDFEEKLPSPEEKLPSPEEKLPSPEEKVKSSEEELQSPEEKLQSPEEKLPTPEEKPTSHKEKGTSSKAREDESKNIASDTMPENNSEDTKERVAGDDVANKLNQSETEGQLAQNLELNTPSKATPDPLSLVPDELYKEMDLERRLTLSALPPNLDTPDCPINNRPEVLPAQPADPEPNVAAIMKLDDQGGLSGQ